MRKFLILVLTTLFFPTYAAETQAPDQIIQETSNKIIKILNEDSERLENNPEEAQRLVNEILLPVIDLNAFCKLILSDHWRAASPQQRQRFSREFKGMLMRTYTKYLVDYAGIEMRLVAKKDAKQHAKRQVVFTKVIQSGKPPLPVDYSFWFNDGRWKAYNVTVDGLSLVHLFRTDFNREIGEKGLDALIERLAKTNLDTEQKPQGH